jgi:hypothetical protein
MKNARFQMVMECPYCRERQNYDGQTGKLCCGECTEEFTVNPPEATLTITRHDHAAEMTEAWKLVNAMAGQEYWDRAEAWLEKHAWAKPKDIVSDHR